MKWFTFIAGAVLTVAPFAFTMTVNGLSLLGLVIMLTAAGSLFRDDVRSGM